MLWPFLLPIQMDGSTFPLDYGDVREDRVVLYGTALPDAKEFIYRIKAGNTGTFAVPPIEAESLYDRSVQSRALGGKIVVVKD